MLTIRVGELFAEVCADNATSSTQSGIWFLPKKSLSDGIKAKLGDSDQVQLQLFFRPDALPKDRFLEKKVATVVTSGFEGMFAEAIEHKGLPASNDLIFGVSERIDSFGKVTKAVDISACTLIAEKLKMMKVSEVIVASINSDLNADNRNQLSTFFRDQGFKVFSSSSSETGEFCRWTKLIEEVQWSHLIEDLDEQLTELKKSVSFSYVRINDVKVSSATFFAGLDIFWLSGNGSKISALLDAQPSDIVEPGFFDAPEFRHYPANQRNGPLLLGKSMRPTALDLFLLEDRALEIDGSVAAQFDRMKSRIEEALVVMSKAHEGTSRIDGVKVVNDTLNIFVTALASEIKSLGLNETLKITGPLASVVVKHLKQIDVNLNCELGAKK